MQKAAKRREGKLKAGLGPFVFWLEFWELADEVDGHYVWRGAVDERGTAVFSPTKGPPLPASHAAWTYDGRKLSPGQALSASCGRKACVRPEHQSVVR